jgi:hypothetical protein
MRNRATWWIVPALLGAWVPAGRGAELRVGAASVSITPDRPVALAGQMHTRIAQAVESPCTAAVLAIESRDGERVLDQAVFVACDLVAIPKALSDRVRARLKDRVPDLDPRKVILSATHTHTAPVVEEGLYDLPAEGIMPPGEYIDFFVGRVAGTIEAAWDARRPGAVGWGLGHAVVAQNRRAVYADGRAVMYGATNAPDFRGIEGYEDHGVEVLFAWDADRKLIATAVNVACPSQEVEGRSAVNADFWHGVRDALRAKHGAGLVVLGWTGAAGDQSPHLMLRQKAEERMRELRGLDRLGELARRVVNAWEEAYEGAKKDIRADVPLVHKVETLELPVRVVTEEEYARARQEAEAAKAPALLRKRLWHQGVVDRYERQQAGAVPPYAMELHALRLGEIALATNDFELYTEFGIALKARGRAIQTFVIQLAGPGTYLPTAEAVRGGGYSAIAESSVVGPEGGAALVEQTLAALNALWPDR